MTESENTGGVVRRESALGGAARPFLGLDLGMDLIDTAEIYADDYHVIEDRKP
jgi:hypothetical protein